MHPASISARPTWGPPNYRRKARKAYLGLARQKDPRKQQRRKGIKQQLQFLRPNFGHIEKLLDIVADEARP